MMTMGQRMLERCHILFLNPDGTVKAEQKISATQGSLQAVLDGNDQFGASVTSLGDLSGNGVASIAVGAHRDGDGAADAGAVYILNLAGYADADFDGLWDHLEDDNVDGDNDPSTLPGPDTDTDGTPDYLDSDDDGDGVPTIAENPDADGDGDPC